MTNILKERNDKYKEFQEVLNLIVTCNERLNPVRNYSLSDKEKQEIQEELKELTIKVNRLKLELIAIELRLTPN